MTDVDVTPTAITTPRIAATVSAGTANFCEHCTDLIKVGSAWPDFWFW